MRWTFFELEKSWLFESVRWVIFKLKKGLGSEMNVFRVGKGVTRLLEVRLVIIAGLEKEYEKAHFQRRLDKKVIVSALNSLINVTKITEYNNFFTLIFISHSCGKYNNRCLVSSAFVCRLSCNL